MKKEEIHLGDWKRILLGQAPVEFMLEVFLRTVIIYLILLIIMRLLGKRMSAQISITEMSVMITLGAIVAPAMEMPDRGLLPTVVVLICVLLLQRGINWLGFKNRRVESIIQGKMDMLVKDGVMQTDAMRQTGVTHEQLFSQLRANGIQQLGEVKRVYLETCGHFSIFRSGEKEPGLSVIPLKDEKLHRKDPHADSLSACLFCASVVNKNGYGNYTCPNCGHQEWTYAVVSENSH